MRKLRTIVALIGLVLLIGACASRQESSPASGTSDEHANMPGMSGQMQGMESSDKAAETGSDEHGTMTHDIPEEAAAVPNPVAVSDASVAAGQTTYTQYCAVCHGEQGEGNGPAAAGLNPKPADFHAPHMQELPDGALFYTITHGREGTAMVAWESIISEPQRWEVVNYLRTFEAEAGH